MGVVEPSIADGIIERFLAELQATRPDGEELAIAVRRLIDDDLLRREEPLVDICRRLAEGEA